METKRYFFVSFWIQWNEDEFGASACGSISSGSHHPRKSELEEKMRRVQFDRKGEYPISITLISISEFKNELEYNVFLGEGFNQQK